VFLRQPEAGKRLREDAMDQIDFNKLWQNFVDTFTNHYTDFNGRVGRAQYWYYILVYVVVGIGVSIVASVLPLGGTLRALYTLALLLPSVGMTARRLQDTGRPGTWAWLLALPLAYTILASLFAILVVLTLGMLVLFLAPLMALIGLVSLAAAVVVIYFCAQPGETVANAYGPVPTPWTPGGAAAAPPAAPPAT
jgi:uncharacterized membrane protein YhaH (DUF805 family)